MSENQAARSPQVNEDLAALGVAYKDRQNLHVTSAESER